MSDIVCSRLIAIRRRTYFEAQSNYWGGPKPPSTGADLQVGDLVRMDVKYPEKHEQIEIPDEWLAQTVKAIHQGSMGRQLQIAMVRPQNAAKNGFIVLPIAVESNMALAKQW